jgi:methylase of polypeptide subunit release factors
MSSLSKAVATPSQTFDPSLDHLSSVDYQHVYEPAEDTFLFLDALHQDRVFLTSHFPHAPICVEVGSGSGMVISYLAALQSGRGLYWATDVNGKAAQATRATMRHNGVRRLDRQVTVAGALSTDGLLTSLLCRLR